MSIVEDGTPYANHGILVAETQANDQLHSWRNSINVVWSSTPPVIGDPIISAWTNFLKGLQRDDSTIIKVELLPYVKGRQPLANQGPIWTSAVNIPCKNHDAGSAYPFNGSSGSPTVGELCLLLLKPKSGGGGGRAGHMFIRNSPPASDVTATAGGPPFFTSGAAPNYIPAIATWCNGNLAAYCGSVTPPRFCLIHAQKVPDVVPAVHDITDSLMGVPQFERLTMHDITSGNKR